MDKTRKLEKLKQLEKGPETEFDLDLKAMGGRLRKARESVHMTIEKMANLTGFSKSNISLSENGLQKPSIHYIFKMYKHYNVDINFIFSGKGEMFMEKEEIDKKSKFKSPLDEMLYMINRYDMIRYALLSYYLSYKQQNKAIINEMIQGDS